MFEDKDRAKAVYDSAMEKASKAEDFDILAAGAVKDLGDKALARKIYEKALASLESGNELLKFARTVNEKLDDPDFVKSIYNKAESVYTEFSDYLKLGKEAFEVTGDAAFASGIFQTAAATNPACSQLVDLALAMAKDLKDKEAAVAVLKQAQSAVKSNADFIKTAKAIQEVVTDDKEWTDAIAFQLEKREEFKDLYADFINREQETKTCATKRALAHEIVEKTGDKYYGAKIYRQAQALTRNFNDFIKLGVCIHQDLKDTEWVKEIFTSLLDKCVTLAYYDELTDAIADTLKDDAWIKEIYKNVETQCAGISDQVKLAAVVATKLNDRDWAKNLLAAAEENSRTPYDLTFVGGAYLRLLDDQDKAIALFEAAEAQCTDQASYAGLVNLVYGQTRDTSFLTRILLAAQKKLTGFDDLLFLAETACTRVADTQLASRLYARAEEKATDNRRLSRLATSLNQVMKDPARASRVLRKIA
jgi:tetratricopeptide (TPR) repeat protein